MSDKTLAIRGLPASVADKLQTKWERREAIIARYRAEAKKTAATLTRTIVAGGVGGALGFVQGRYDRTEIAGMPLDATTAVACHVAAFFLPEGEDYLHAAGDGAFAVYAWKEGLELGRDRKAKANGQQSSGGYLRQF